jgi:carboxypeptidase D
MYRHKILCSFVLALLLPVEISSKRRIPSLQVKTENIENKIVKEEVVTNINELRNLQSQRNELPIPGDHQVTNLPYLSPNAFPTKHYAGHIPASHNDDKKLFYWLFLPDSDDATTVESESDIPLIIWLNGGPGCSSMDGLWIENGPFRLIPPQVSGKNDWNIDINPYSWHKAPAYVLYVDQPVGTGLSFTKLGNYCKSDLQIDIDFHLFLENFMMVYKDFFLKSDKEKVVSDEGKEMEQYRMKRPLYFSGESHAGHYIPSMMDYILKKNDETKSKHMPMVKFDLKGGAIGNGWIDPYYQYSASDAAYGAALIDLAQKEDLDRRELECRKDLKEGNLASGRCFDLLSDVINDSAGKSAKKKVSVYDNRLWERKGVSRDFPPGHKYVEKYLGGWSGKSYPNDMTVNYKDVLKALHAEESIAAKQRFEECTDPPYDALSKQDGLGVRDEVVAILSHRDKPRLLFFNGVNDMICNHVGNERLLDNLPWAHQEEWTLSTRYAWDPFPDGENGVNEPAGYIKQFDNLLFLKVMASGHMVPMDVPDIALEMIRSFVYSKPFDSGPQKLSRGIPGTQQCQDTVQTFDCSVCEDDDEQKSSSNIASDEIGNKTTSNCHLDQSEEMINIIPNGMLLGAILGVGLTLLVGAFRNRRCTWLRKRTKVYDKDDMTALQNDLSLSQTEII